MNRLYLDYAGHGRSQKDEALQVRVTKASEVGVKEKVYPSDYSMIGSSLCCVKLENTLFFFMLENANLPRMESLVLTSSRWQYV